MANLSQVCIIGEKLRRLREKAGITQKELAKRYTTEREKRAEEFPFARTVLINSDISRLENSKPDKESAQQHLQTMQVLAAVLGVQLEQFIQPESPDEATSASTKASRQTSDILYVGALSDLAHITLPFMSAQAWSSAASLVQPADPTATILYLLPPRAAIEYMNNQSRVFEVRSDAMSPEIRFGECVVADPVPEARWELLSNNIIIIAYDETTTIKCVRENELLTRRALTLYPNDADLAPLTIRRELIRAIYLVRESFERKKWA